MDLQYWQPQKSQGNIYLFYTRSARMHSKLDLKRVKKILLYSIQNANQQPWSTHYLLLCWPFICTWNLSMLLPLTCHVSVLGDLFAVHSRRTHSKDIWLFLEPEWTLGHLLRLRGQHHASLADGESRYVAAYCILNLLI